MLRGRHQRRLKSHQVAGQQEIENLAASVRQGLMSERPTLEKREQFGVFLAHVYDFRAGRQRAMVDLHALNEIDFFGGLLNERRLHSQWDIRDTTGYGLKAKFGLRAAVIVKTGVSSAMGVRGRRPSATQTGGEFHEIASLDDRVGRRARR